MINFKLLKRQEKVAALNKGSGLWLGPRPINIDAGQNPVLILRAPDGSLGAAITSNDPPNVYSNAMSDFLGKALQRFSKEGFPPERLEAAVVGGADNAEWKWARLVRILQQLALPFKKFDEGGLYYRDVYFDPKKGEVAIFRATANPDDWNPAAAKLSLASGTKGFSDGHAGGVVANATRFFRERLSFTAMREIVVPTHLQLTPEEPLHIWSAACSTGAEAYSYAMYAHRLLQKAGAECPFKIFATDINAKLIEQGKKGEYTVKRNELKDFGAYFHHYGSVKGEVVHFGEMIKRHVSFGTFDLKNRPKRGGFRMIVCANVFQYYDDEARLHFLENFISALARPGFLFVGPLKDEISRRLGLRRLTKYKMFMVE